MSLKTLMVSELLKKVGIVMGTRPGIIKMAPLVKEFTSRGIENFIIHTGQHYSENMDLSFFIDLQLPTPPFRIQTTQNYKTHADQTAEMMSGVEKVLLQTKPLIVLVCGDANTNLAAGLAARKLGIIVGHVESGLRSHDWSMPEEHNRIILDHICELLFAPTKAACQNLINDNVRGQIHLTGNTIVDSTLENIKIAERKVNVFETLGVRKGKYVLFTCHREENVDAKDRLKSIMDGVRRFSEHISLSVIFPAHPRTAKRLKEFGLLNGVLSTDSFKMIKPMGYLEFLMLIRHAAIILTDSGGIQEESCILQTPCVTLRNNTERPETIAVGSNCVAGVHPDSIHAASMKMLSIERKWDIPFGDGFAAVRIADIVESALENGVRVADLSRSLRKQLRETFLMEQVIIK